MKKVLSLVMILILSLTACGGKAEHPMIRISENTSVRSTLATAATGSV